MPVDNATLWTCCYVKTFRSRCIYCGKERKTNKDKCFGELILEFDESEGRVSDFNSIFNEFLGGDQEAELIIGEPYTHLGREITIGGVEKRYLRKDEHQKTQSYVFDTHHKKTDKWLWTYKSVETIARDYEVADTAVRWWMAKENGPVTIKKRYIVSEEEQEEKENRGVE